MSFGKLALIFPEMLQHFENLTNIWNDQGEMW